MARKQHSGISDQRKASIRRMEDAEALFHAKRWRGAMYMAGYAVECRLKYKLMQQWRCRTLEELEERLEEHGTPRDLFTHSLHLLLEWAGGLERLQQDNRPLWFKFSQKVNNWQPAWRYSPDLGDHDDAEEFLAATKEIITWIDNSL
jgi:HEPN domain-containing protein